jgi:hypothetical protein
MNHVAGHEIIQATINKTVSIIIGILRPVSSVL